MRKLFVFILLAVLTIGTSIGLYAGSFSKDSISDVQSQSSSSVSMIIDHLPFVINKTDVYRIARDLEVNGTGITILANNTVLIGQGHTISGNGTGCGINVTANNVIITGCKIANFERGINIQPMHLGASIYQNVGIYQNKIYNNSEVGIRICYNSGGNTIRRNILVKNYVNLEIYTSTPNIIYDNFIAYPEWGNADDISTHYYNTTKTQGTNIISGPYLGGNYWDDYSGEDLDGDGLGDTDLPYISWHHNLYLGDYLPLVDIIPPEYSDVSVFNFGPSSTSLSITWKDNVQVDKAILELDGVNYTDAQKVDESLGFNEYYTVEHSITFLKLFSLPLGTHYYRWFANDTSGHWNSTSLLSFNVTAVPQINSVEISPILKVDANITCEGVNNITEILKFVDLNFKIDDQWYMMSMSYNVETGLYSALIPAYNQLANKTILIHVTAMDVNNHLIGSDVYIYHVPEWVKADLNRDGKVDWKDCNILFKYYSPTGGETSPTPLLK